MSDQRIFMNFEITGSSHTLEAYRGRGGYQSLEKALREQSKSWPND